MVLRRLHRILTPVLVTWFVLAAGEAPFAHRCPVHDAPQSVPAGHGAAHHGAADEQAPSSSKHDCCTCVGACTAAGAVAAPADSPTVVAVAAPLTREATPAGYTAHHATARLLPFANGPPQTSV